MRDRPNEHHRRVAAAKAGRPLTSVDIVHHTNEDKTDNAPSNLEVTTRSEHGKGHAAARRAGTSQLRAALRMPKERKKLY